MALSYYRFPDSALSHRKHFLMNISVESVVQYSMPSLRFQAWRYLRTAELGNISFNIKIIKTDKMIGTQELFVFNCFHFIMSSSTLSLSRRLLQSGCKLSIQAILTIYNVICDNIAVFIYKKKTLAIELLQNISFPHVNLSVKKFVVLIGSFVSDAVTMTIAVNISMMENVCVRVCICVLYLF